MSNEFKFGHNLFGYTTLVRDGETFVALRGETEPELRVGMQVILCNLVAQQRSYFVPILQYCIDRPF